MKVTGIAASLHAESFIYRLLEAAAGELPEDVEFETWQGLDEVPPYAAGPPPGPVRRLLRLLASSDAVLLTAPEHSLLPAELLHALRWMATGKWLDGKRVAVMSASARACGAMWAQAELYKQLQGMGAVVMGAELVVSPACPHFDDEGRLTAADLRAQVRRVIGELCPAPIREPALSIS
ncbi:hypothetical protein HII36_16615 [Nonomuraea sp. NN258]|uniref:NADPH-dependent FMN reductase n=1 Tax=Nonomuraea antri TaxID=2730852 RepID=UPI001568B4DB|nr:NAD(P)H-dependent oxidoreductase [Nonomuraea antri]NRQ33458.1 hypothetical protein [Nonomuraea antri]